MPSLFENFPKTSDGVVNTTIRIDFLNQIKTNTVLFEYVQVKDGQTPEQLAYQVYGDPQLYWIILMINDIDDLYTGWCMSDSQLYNFVSEKYGVQNIYSIHHYETAEGIWTNTVTTHPVSNLTFEQNINELKRKVKLLKKDYVPQVLAELKTQLRKAL